MKTCGASEANNIKIQMILSFMADDEGHCDGDDYAFFDMALPIVELIQYCMQR